MAITVRVPTPLQKVTGGKGEVSAVGSTIREIFADMEKNHPGLKERIYSEDGELRRFINIYINEEDIRFLESEDSKVKDGDVISIIPAIAGGTH
ncbi:MAG: MoaD/ThiS family protein [Nitrospinae bacterium]|nr:MoaD/ThiS family protein [Nitrospinota bacterium]